MGTSVKPASLNLAVVEGFYDALAARDFERLAPFLHDDITWTISGPVNILPFCGPRMGKDVVLRMLAREVPALLSARRFIRQTTLIDGDRVAVLGRLTATLREGGRTVSYRIAQFFRFQDETVIDYNSIIDSFDAVEQVLGHALSIHEGSKAAGTCVSV